MNNSQIKEKVLNNHFDESNEIIGTCAKCIDLAISETIKANRCNTCGEGYDTHLCKKVIVDAEILKLRQQIGQDEMIIEDIARIVGMNPKEYIDGAVLVTAVSEIRQATIREIFEKIEKFEVDTSDFGWGKGKGIVIDNNEWQQLKKQFGVEEVK